MTVAVTPWGGGLWGLLRTLTLEGPRTVPQIARARTVTRQRIQKLADEMAALGLVEFVDNPAHRRSRLLRLTPTGEEAYHALSRQLEEWAEELAADIAIGELEEATAVLKRVRAKLEAEVGKPGHT